MNVNTPFCDSAFCGFSFLRVRISLGIVTGFMAKKHDFMRFSHLLVTNCGECENNKENLAAVRKIFINISEIV